LTFYERSEHMIKRAFEVSFLFVALAIIVFGYAVTGNPVLGVCLSLMAAIFCIAFFLSFLLPKIMPSQRALKMK
ncbi:hypothetical protein KEJ19_07970, partial [Candidatus Bathyarchaeota archaeon]|nr:hypothetical protein [Candidatus Bathyarchaeota archaeon]